MTIYRTRYRESSLRGSTNGRQRTRSPGCRGSVEKRFAAKKAKIDTYHVQLLASFLERLRTTEDGDGTLLDHSIILYGSGLGDGDLHSHNDLPVLVAGGGSGQVRGGRHISLPETPMANLLVSLLNKVGVPTERLGDSNGRLSLEPLPGV